MEIERTASTLGKTIADRRKRLGTSQQEVADLAGISVRALSSLERGKPTIRLDTLVPVLEVLGLELRTTVRDKS